MGTITSISRSFNAGLNIGTNFEEVVGFDFSLSRTDTKSSSLEIKKTTSLDLAVNGPSTDGIDHDEDILYLWLSPQVTVTIDPADNLNWQLGFSRPNRPWMASSVIFLVTYKQL
jgi:hypothetical protein